MSCWDREDISYCKCDDVSYYIHAHCPCQECNGKAVSTSTEYRHWQVAQSQWHTYSDDSTDSSEYEDLDPSINHGGDGRINSDDSSSNSDGGSTNPDGSTSGTDNRGGDSNDHGGDGGDNNSDNSRDVIDAVIKAMVITEDVSGS